MIVSKKCENDDKICNSNKKLLKVVENNHSIFW